MAVPSIDKEFMQYWQKLPPAQKQSLLCLAKSYVDAQEAGLRKNYMENGAALLPEPDRNYLTQEEVEEESEKWCRKCTGYFGQL